MRPLADAQRDVLSTVRLTEIVEVALWDAAGLVLAADVGAPHDVPPFTNSAMDGYAVIGADVEEVPVTLEVLEDVAAGHVAGTAVRPGTAIKIMTGAPLPAGADTVVKVEDTEPGEGTVRILNSAPAGTAVRPAGGDLGAGTLVFEAGTRLTARHVAVLASIGVAAPAVRRRPTVAIMSTGDEVQPPETETLQPGQIRDTNRPLLARMLTELGVDVIDLGIVRDDETLLRSTVERAAAAADAIFTSGGVSMGEYDLVKAVLRTLGDIDFWQVAMQPAKPFAFGTIDGTPLFGLPGNPVSVMVAFEQFARPALLHMMGSERLFRPRVRAVMDEAIMTDPAKTVFSRVEVAIDDHGVFHARPSGGQSSNVLSALAAADAFGVVPVGVGEVAIGDPISLEMFTWPERRTAADVLGRPA
jgi:molybdenum cofactor synthesis domain-containing protein